MICQNGSYYYTLLPTKLTLLSQIRGAELQSLTVDTFAESVLNIVLERLEGTNFTAFQLSDDSQFRIFSQICGQVANKNGGGLAV